MPKGTLVEEEKWKLPKDVPLPAVLNSVTEELKEGTSKRTGKEYSFTQWTWEFQVSEGDYAGLRAWIDTDARFTTHPDNKVRQIAEALLGSELELGHGLDTDDLIGLPCEIIVDNTEYTKANGEVSYLSPITQVWPAGTSTGADGEPPF